MLLLALLPFVVIVAIAWVNGIDYMKNNYPDYKGEDLFDEEPTNKD